METAVQERLSYLQRHKDMATFKIASLQKTLDDSVPAAELDLQNRFVQILQVQGSHSTWKTWKNDSNFSSHGNIMEF